MEAQEARAELPRPELSELLAKHYGGLYPADEISDDNILSDTGDECKEQVIAYLRDNPCITHEDIVFIKRFTKVANHLLRTDPGRLDGLMERLYDYHMQGIFKIQDEMNKGGQDEQSNSSQVEQLMTMRTHLHGHAADVAYSIFVYARKDDETPLEKKLYWGTESYNNEMMAISFCTGDEEYRFIRQDYAGKISMRMFNLLDKNNGRPEDKLLWLERCHNNSRISAEMSAGIDSELAAAKYDRAAESARLIAGIIRDDNDVPLEKKIEWEEASYRNYMMSAEVNLRDDIITTVYRYQDAAVACTRLFELTQDTAWLGDGYRLHVEAAKMTVNILPGFSASQHNDAGDAAKKMYEATKDQRWKKRADLHYSKFFSHYASTSYTQVLSRSMSRRKSKLERIKAKRKNLRLF